METFPFSRFAATAVVLAVLTACGKNKNDAALEAGSVAPDPGTTQTAPATAPAAPAAAANPQAESLPGENAVRAAMASKDYETAVSRLVALQPLATAGEKQTEYTALYGEVIDTLRAESGTDRKAAAALVSLNALTRGR